MRIVTGSVLRHEDVVAAVGHPPVRFSQLHSHLRQPRDRNGRQFKAMKLMLTTCLMPRMRRIHSSIPVQSEAQCRKSLSSASSMPMQWSKKNCLNPCFLSFVSLSSFKLPHFGETSRPRSSKESTTCRYSTVASCHISIAWPMVHR